MCGRRQHDDEWGIVGKPFGAKSVWMEFIVLAYRINARTVILVCVVVCAYGGVCVCVLRDVEIN